MIHCLSSLFLKGSTALWAFTTYSGRKFQIFSALFRKLYFVNEVAIFHGLLSSAQACEPDPCDFQPLNRKNHYARRHSVSAERYDPEADDDDDEVRVIHPKSDEKRRRLIDAVHEILIFRCLDDEQMGDVIDAMFERRVAPGEHVITQGDDGDNFYAIESGSYDVFVTSSDGTGPNKIHQFTERGSFGELALMYNMPRSATVVALDGGTLWAMDRASFRRIILKSAFRKRKMYEQLLQVGRLSDYRSQCPAPP